MKKLNICLILMLFSIYGCMNPQPSDVREPLVSARLLYKSAFGGGAHSQPAAAWITEPNRYRYTYQLLGKTTIGARPKKLPARVDFSRERVLLVTMGQRPTAGYQLDLIKPSVDIIADTASLHLVWIKPPPDAILPQVVTSPCILLALPKGNYSRIEVLDQTGRMRLQVDTRE
ncbi:MAG: protease complex subunit PrcB family protein [Planctomycetota bacterium]|jgi:hypothetical protein